VPLWEDYKLRIAHNKVMIFDGQTVETGSFNFTDAAQYHNAENMLIIHNQALAQKYLANWEKRKQQSKRISD
jgi:phosphatidylserine/phosphatidylglycerophosphate/cardiolipin synthase-like enzyme